ncbi:MAG: YhcH/YjgK/YiaL family protein [Armatimonadota bacterium]|nr:MAG: YhcH/YjgK/YiaL family protein [Armatimonadota bacterium]
MIVDELKNWRRYAQLAELRPAFEWLEQHAGEDLPEGRIEIDGARLFALPQSYAPKPVEGSLFEAHRRYADVQYIAAGTEMIGYAPTETLTVETPHDAGKDIAFYARPSRYTPVALTAGMFAVFYPEDAHMPCCRLDSDAIVRKLVIKIAL